MRKFLFVLVGAALLALPVRAQDVEISGLVDVGYTHSFNDPAAVGGALGRGFSVAQDDEFGINQAELAVSKAAEPAGFNLKLDFFNALLIDGAGTTADDIAIRNANVVYKADVGNGLTITAGKFDSLIGRDRIDSADNWFISHGLLFTGSAVTPVLNPLTHTGIRASYPIMDNCGLTLGLNNGANKDLDIDKNKSFEGGLTFSPLEALDLALNVNYGNEFGTGTATLLLNLVAEYDVTEDLSAYGEFLYGDIEDVGSATGFGLGAQYKITDQYGVSARWEWLSANPDFAGAATIDGWQFTITGHAWLAENLEARIEYRHDDSDPTFDTDGNGTLDDGPFVDDSANGVSDSQDTIGVQLIYSF